jgi:PAS domain S-box-containing protein
MSDDHHPTLRRELARLRLSTEEPPSAAAWSELLERLDQGYASADDDRRTTERSLESSSVEKGELQRRLQAARDRVGAVVDALDDGVCLVDEEGTIELVNPAIGRLLGRATEGMVGAHADAILVFRGPEVGDAPIRDIVAAQRTRRYDDGRLERADGTWFPAMLTISPCRKPDGRPGAVVAFRDVSAAKRAEEEAREARVAAEVARQAEHAKDEFLTTMSHELRTPLNAIIGYSEILAEELPDLGAESLVGDVGKIHGAGKHLLGLINDLLDLSKIEAGRMDLYVETFAVEDLVRDAVATVMPLVAKNDNQITLTVDPKCGVIACDLTKLRQCLYNLLSNASKFTSAGAIGLDVRLEDRRIVFDVTDTGIGMSEEQLGRLFRPFTQADASTTRKYGGTGLGLTLTLKLARMMGGELEVTSREGEGSRFRLVIPVTQQEAQLAVSPAVDADDAILVIDDDADARDLLGRLLSREGYRVVTARSGPEALAIARQKPPRAITLDALMPGMDGWSVLAELKADPVLAAVPVIMVTMVDDRNRAYTLGATEFLGKPVDRARLLATLGRLKGPPEDERGEVLVIEGDPNVRELIRELAEREGWSVVEAANSGDALAHLEQAKPALVLLDLLMPGMGGFEFLEQFRRRPEWSQIPVVVLSALSREEGDPTGRRPAGARLGPAASWEDVVALVRDRAGPA